MNGDVYQAILEGRPRTERTIPEDNNRNFQEIGAFKVPPGYEVWADGVYRIVDFDNLNDEQASINATPSPDRKRCLEMITRKPMWIRTNGHSLDRGEHLIEIAFHDAISGRLAVEWVTREQIATRQKIISLARYGLPIYEINANGVLNYLDSALHLNGPSLPLRAVARRSGPYAVKAIEKVGELTTTRDVTGWLVGEHWIGPENPTVYFDKRDGLHEFAAGLTTSGDPDEWRNAWIKWGGTSPKIRWLLNSVLAAPLLQYVKLRTFGIHHWCKSGGGKTAIMKLSLTAWGDPQLLMQTFNGTELSMTEHFNYINGLPLAFDELQSSKSKNQGTMIYDLTNERGRKRAGQRGGLEDAIAKWSSVIRTTGEEPLIGKGENIDLGGQGNRCMQLRARVVERAAGEEIYRFLGKKHHGFGGREFLQHLYQLSNKPRGIELLNSQYNELKDWLENNLQEGSKDRADKLAVIALATWINTKIMLRLAETEEDGATFQARDAAIRDTALSDALLLGALMADDDYRESVTEQALATLEDDFRVSRRMWCDYDNQSEREILEHGGDRSLGAVIKNDEVWIIPAYFKQLMQKARLPYTRVIKDLRDEGTLKSVETHRLRMQRNVGVFNGRVHVLDRARVFRREPDLAETLTTEDE